VAADKVNGARLAQRWAIIFSAGVSATSLCSTRMFRPLSLAYMRAIYALTAVSGPAAGSVAMVHFQIISARSANLVRI